MCGKKSFVIRQTFAIKADCHPLESKRFAYYKCQNCGSEYLLTTPQGKLELINSGKISKDVAKSVLSALNLPLEYVERLP